MTTTRQCPLHDGCTQTLEGHGEWRGCSICEKKMREQRDAFILKHGRGPRLTDFRDATRGRPEYFWLNNGAEFPVEYEGSEA